MSSGTIYASIGNSDDQLSQAQWADFVRRFRQLIGDTATAIHGEWFSAPDSPFQNMCMCFEVALPAVAELQAELVELRRLFKQDSVAWAATYETRFI